MNQVRCFLPSKWRGRWRPHRRHTAPGTMTEYMQLHQLITRPGDGTNELVQYLKSLHAVEPVATKTLHAVDHGGHTLLMVALKYRKQERATALLEHGSDLRRTNNAGWNCFHWAAFVDDGKLLTLLAQHTLRRWSADALTEALNATTSSGKTPKDMASGKARAWLERCGATRGADLCGLVWGKRGPGVVGQDVPWQQIIEPPSEMRSWLGGVLDFARASSPTSSSGRATPRSTAESPLPARVAQLRGQPPPRVTSWPELQSMVAAVSRPAEVSWLEVMAQCARVEIPTIGMAQRGPATPPARRGLFSSPPPHEAPRPESPPTRPICRTQPISQGTGEQAELRCRGLQPSERPALAAAPPTHTVGAGAAWEDVGAEAHAPSTAPSARVAPRRRGAVRAVVLALMIGGMAIASWLVVAHARSPLG